MDLSKMTLSELKNWLRDEESQDKENLEIYLKRDVRKGARDLIKRRLNNMKRMEAEEHRLEELTMYERELWDQGLEFIAGVDEAGRGPLAGPVVAAAVILPAYKKIHQVRDSKQLSPQKREELFTQIQQEALCFSTSIVDVSYIDEFNIYQAGLEAMRRALVGLKINPQHILTDAFRIPGIRIQQNPLIKGDSLSLSVACASILAKVIRDRLMMEYDTQYPQYGFGQHKGYATTQHFQAIKEHGISPVHRRSFNLKGEREG